MKRNKFLVLFEDTSILMTASLPVDILFDRVTAHRKSNKGIWQFFSYGDIPLVINVVAQVRRASELEASIGNTYSILDTKLKLALCMSKSNRNRQPIFATIRCFLLHAPFTFRRCEIVTKNIP